MFYTFDISILMIPPFDQLSTYVVRTGSGTLSPFFLASSLFSQFLVKHVRSEDGFRCPFSVFLRYTTMCSDLLILVFYFYAYIIWCIKQSFFYVKFVTLSMTCFLGQYEPKFCKLVLCINFQLLCFIQSNTFQFFLPASTRHNFL